METSKASAETSLKASTFEWPEYVAFVIMLIASIGIGVFHGCFRNKKTTNDFLLAGRSMGTFPVALSLIATYISAITLLGTPAEIYQYGSQYWVIMLGFTLVTISTAYLYLPIFYDLNITSVYQYLEMRFSRNVRLLGTCVSMFASTMYMAMAVYAPALALSQVTGLSVNIGVAVIFIVCVFYTALGGMKAVIWTDVLQAGVMYGAIAAIAIKGTIDIGGFTSVFEIAKTGSRIEYFNFDFDPRTRHTFWGLFIGAYFTWLSVYGVGQTQVQRYLTVPSKQSARRALFVNCIGLNLLVLVLCYCGLLVYATYKDCDPLTSKMITSTDQLLPLFVMDTLGNIPGLPGLFVAGIFSGVLSSVSSVLNALAAIALEDIVKARWTNLSNATETNVSKCLAVAFGVAAYGLVFVAQHLGGVLQANFTLNGMIQGPLLGLFTLGMFFPWANSKGALVGTLTAMTTMACLGAGSSIYKYMGWIEEPKLPFSVEKCLGNGSVGVTSLPDSSTGDVLTEIYRLSYIWYALTSQCMVVAVGLLVSFMTGAQDPRKLNPLVISKPVSRFLNFVLPRWLLKKIKWEIGILYVQNSDTELSPNLKP